MTRCIITDKLNCPHDHITKKKCSKCKVLDKNGIENPFKKKE